VPATARLVINQSELRTQLVGPGGLVTRHVIRQIRLIRNRAVLYCPVDTGNLRSSITSATRTEGMLVIGRVGTAVEYAADVHEGVRAQTVTVAAHQVKARTIKAHTVKAHTRKAYTVPARNGRKSYTVPATEVPAHQVAARTQLAHTVPSHSRKIAARAGRPFLRRAMEEVIDRNA